MNKFDLSNELTYKFLRAGEVEELHETKIISGDHVQPGVRNTGAVHICFLCVTRPDAQNLVTQNTVQEKEFTTVSRINIRGYFYIEIRVSPGPCSPGDPVDQGLLCDDFTAGNLMNLPLI